MLRELRETRLVVPKFSARFRLTLARRGPIVPSTGSPMRRTPNPFTGEERTYVRAGTCADLRGGVRAGKPVGGRLRGHACRLGTGGRAPRRSELPTQRRLLGALPRP